MREMTQVSEAEGGLKQQLPHFDEPAPCVGEISVGEERLFEDDSDAASDRNQMQRAASGPATVRRAHAVTRDDDDLLPAF
jgi:type IV secretion system protein VirD4